MICLDVLRNGGRLCVAGVKTGVFGATVMSVERANETGESRSMELRVGGLTGDDVHVDWVIEKLAVGDELLLKVVEQAAPDSPRDLRPMNPEEVHRGNLASSRKYYAELRRTLVALEAEWGKDTLERIDGDA